MVCKELFETEFKKIDDAIKAVALSGQFKYVGVFTIFNGMVPSFIISLTDKYERLGFLVRTGESSLSANLESKVEVEFTWSHALLREEG